MKRILTIGAFVVALVTALVFGLDAWTMIGDTDISVAGWVSIGFGVVATLAVGGALMGLVFYSARRGYDEIDRPG
jgi:hypothetical protein